jgi:YVTN family beta-propeller protein
MRCSNRAENIKPKRLTLTALEREDAMRLRLCRLLAVAGFVSCFLASCQTLARNAYITNFDDKTVTVIDTATNTVTATIPVGANPEGVGVTPDGRTVYVANVGETFVSVIDTATNTVTATIPVGAGPFGVAVTPDGSTVYVGTGFNPGTVSVIDTATNTVTATIPVFGPSGVAVTPDGSSVYVVYSGFIVNTVTVIDTATNTVTATIPVGAGPHRRGGETGPTQTRDGART